MVDVLDKTMSVWLDFLFIYCVVVIGSAILFYFPCAAVELGIAFVKRSDGGDVAKTAAHDCNVNITLLLGIIPPKHLVRISADGLTVVEHSIIFSVLAFKSPPGIFCKELLAVQAKGDVKYKCAFFHMKRISKGRQSVSSISGSFVVSLARTSKMIVLAFFSAFSPREIPLARDARTPQRLALLAQNEDR